MEALQNPSPFSAIKSLDISNATRIGTEREDGSGERMLANGFDCVRESGLDVSNGGRVGRVVQNGSGLRWLVDSDRHAGLGDVVGVCR